MKATYFTFILCLTLAVMGCSAANRTTPHVLLITGGHGYDKEQFDVMLGKLGITFDHAEHPDAHPLLKEDRIGKYDAVLLYDMPKEISEEAQRDFISMLEKGKGLVALHHAFCSYDFWPEYVKIIGGRYHHFPWIKDGIEQKPSTYKHDVNMQIHVEDTNHPVTNGITDFEIMDEAYGGTEILSTVHPLLSTDEAASGPLVGWTNTYGHSRIVTLTLGHDNQSWENPSFIKLLTQAIKWVASDK